MTPFVSGTILRWRCVYINLLLLTGKRKNKKTKRTPSSFTYRVIHKLSTAFNDTNKYRYFLWQRKSSRNLACLLLSILYWFNRTVYFVMDDIYVSFWFWLLMMMFNQNWYSWYHHQIYWIRFLHSEFYI